MPFISKIRKIPDLLEQYTVLHSDPDEAWRLDTRKKAVEANNRTIYSMGEKTVAYCASHCVGFFANRMLSHYSQDGYTVVGTGALTTVLRTDEKIIKVVRNTPRDEQTRLLAIDKYRALIRANTATHLDVAVPTTVDDAFMHPRTGRQCIVFRQELIPGMPVERIADADSHLVAQLRDFAAKSLDEIVPDGLGPDVLGAGNLFQGLTDGQLRLVDTIPMTSESHNFSSNTRRLGKLAKIKHPEQISEIFASR